MYYELFLRLPCTGDFIKQSIREELIDVVRPGAFDPNGRSTTCLIYDRDGCVMWEVNLSYENMKKLLNGQEVPKKPDPVEIECWAVIHKSGDYVRPFREKVNAVDFHASMLHNEEYDIIPMKGTYTRG